MFLLVNEFNGNLDIISKPETEEEQEEKNFLRINTSEKAAGNSPTSANQDWRNAAAPPSVPLFKAAVQDSKDLEFYIAI
jgi:hypothetical protein